MHAQFPQALRADVWDLEKPTEAPVEHLLPTVSLKEAFLLPNHYFPIPPPPLGPIWHFPAKYILVHALKLSALHQPAPDSSSLLVSLYSLTASAAP